MKALIITVVIILILFGGYFFFVEKEHLMENEVIDKKEDPQTSDDPITPPLTHSLIKVDQPIFGGTVSSPIQISGEARGYWFFEASFPIVVVDWDGKIIGQGIATATEDWMTEDFVPFTAEISYDKSEISGNYSDKGTLIFRKDNPSGLPENDDAFEMPIIFQ